ncbi:MAG: hypothetical protein UX44_C0027G0003 [candidate division WWE3 bacterium GW2011_GWA1_46_21]|uniref:Aminoglycoside phosphotransferase domain-containing protein n=2 Tax=Katanobacteria TaxID=422282 RepID=A0A0G1RJE9_UNCKA|nr:MAG: hypothetical protein UX44_C0027G0003 [candidate division WWE3 bacterium GW2011_GWA1_46_21]KKU49654.1 MAG: hypothetical protein UX73_C0030G0010 [candidate division WWE3 bacterium GW2011_GWC1_47_10]
MPPCIKTRSRHLPAGIKTASGRGEVLGRTRRSKILYNIFMPSEKDVYLQNVTQYHKELEETIAHEYGIEPTFTNILAWGYTTTAFFVETKAGNHTARLSTYSSAKLASVEKDVITSQALNAVLPTARFVKNKTGAYTSIVKNGILRLSEHIEGVPPFDMTVNILNQCVDLLVILHRRANFLHGDPTPSNFLVSYNKVVAILDFEESKSGPVEWDLSKMAVFFWFRMQDRAPAQVLKAILNRYNSKNIDLTLLMTLCKKHIQNHLDNIRQSMTYYSDKTAWEQDVAFTVARLAEITWLIRCPA